MVNEILSIHLLSPHPVLSTAANLERRTTACSTPSRGPSLIVQ